MGLERSTSSWICMISFGGSAPVSRLIHADMHADVHADRAGVYLLIGVHLLDFLTFDRLFIAYY